MNENHIEYLKIFLRNISALSTPLEVYLLSGISVIDSSLILAQPGMVTSLLSLSGLEINNVIKKG